MTNGTQVAGKVVTALLGTVLVAGFPTVPGATAAANTSDVSSWLVRQLLALQPGTENGGIYANKPGCRTGTGRRC